MSLSQQIGTNVRLDVARALSQIIRHQRTTEWIRVHRPQWLQTPLHSELLYGTLRHYLSLEAGVHAKLNRPLKAKDIDIHHLMLVGVYQLKYTSIAEHAAINECVSACQKLGKPWAKGLVNAVLRQEQRDAATDGAAVPPAITAADHPAWLRDMLTAQYPELANELMQANGERAPMSLRINPCVTNYDIYKRQLSSAGIAYQDGPWPEAVILDEPKSAVDLPGWEQGTCAVQDLGAQQAAHVLSTQLTAQRSRTNPMHILDACAAPGGKLFHLREMLIEKAVPHRLWAMDVKEVRLQELALIGERLGHSTRYDIDNADPDSITLICADGSKSTLIFEQLFDMVLIDAPCTGSGTIRRNPEIRLLLKPSSVLEQQSQQLKLIQNLWQHVRPGGTLLYSTCSVFAEENDQVIHHFLRENPDATVATPTLELGFATAVGWQLLPTNRLTDGLYYSVLRKFDDIDEANTQ